MKAWRLVLVVLALALALAGCGSQKEAAKEPDALAQATEEAAARPGVVILTAAEIEAFNQRFAPFAGEGTLNPTDPFFTSYYDEPADIDLAQFLDQFPTEHFVTEDGPEFEALKALPNWPFKWVGAIAEMPVSIHKYPAEMVDEVLRKYADTSLDDLSGVGQENLSYLPAYDAYYNYTSDFGPGFFSCTRGEREGDIIRLSRDYDDGATVTLTLQMQEEGFLIRSFRQD